ncbi:hypothetical protein SUGI_1054480 [Cryptomeria japonica]|nr:hypothetical protein SUGI_1054480 [Cryptomeria japonica]
MVLWHSGEMSLLFEKKKGKHSPKQSARQRKKKTWHKCRAFVKGKPCSDGRVVEDWSRSQNLLLQVWNRLFEIG